MQFDSNHSDKKRSYTKAQKDQALSVEKYKTSEKGITFENLIATGIVPHNEDYLNRLLMRG
jgi:hypothetical protein